MTPHLFVAKVVFTQRKKTNLKQVILFKHTAQVVDIKWDEIQKGIGIRQTWHENKRFSLLNSNDILWLKSSFEISKGLLRISRKLLFLERWQDIALRGWSERLEHFMLVCGDSLEFNVFNI